MRQVPLPVRPPYSLTAITSEREQRGGVATHRRTCSARPATLRRTRAERVAQRSSSAAVLPSARRRVGTKEFRVRVHRDQRAERYARPVRRNDGSVTGATEEFGEMCADPAPTAPQIAQTGRNASRPGHAAGEHLPEAASRRLLPENCQGEDVAGTRVTLPATEHRTRDAFTRRRRSRSRRCAVNE